MGAQGNGITKDSRGSGVYPERVIVSGGPGGAHMTAHATLSVLLGVTRFKVGADPRTPAVIPGLISPLHDAIALGWGP